jgi:hypothetical protein
MDNLSEEGTGMIWVDRRMTGAYGSPLDALLLPRANDLWTRPSEPVRYVQRLLCQRCERYYLAPSPASVSQPCPSCGEALSQVGTWDLECQGTLPWWDDPEDDR